MSYITAAWKLLHGTEASPHSYTIMPTYYLRDSLGCQQYPPASALPTTHTSSLTQNSSSSLADVVLEVAQSSSGVLRAARRFG